MKIVKEYSDYEGYRIILSDFVKDYDDSEQPFDLELLDYFEKEIFRLYKIWEHKKLEESVKNVLVRKIN